MFPVHGLKIYGPATIEIPHIGEYANKSDAEALKNVAQDTNENCRKDSTIKKHSEDVLVVQPVE